MLLGSNNAQRRVVGRVWPGPIHVPHRSIQPWKQEGGCLASGVPHAVANTSGASGWVATATTSPLCPFTTRFQSSDGWEMRRSSARRGGGYGTAFTGSGVIHTSFSKVPTRSCRSRGSKSIDRIDWGRISGQDGTRSSHGRSQAS